MKASEAPTIRDRDWNRLKITLMPTDTYTVEF